MSISRMQVSVFAPSARLAPFVSAFRVVEAAEESTRVLVPDAGITLGIRFSGSATLLESGQVQVLPAATFAGLRSTARHLRTSAGGGMVLAAFHPGGAARFFQHPLHELFGETASLELFLRPSEIARAKERIQETKTHRERVAVLETILLELLRNDEPDPLVAAAVHAIRSRRGRVRIAELASALDVRIDPLEKRFRHEVGASPKQLATILRLRNAVDSYRPGMNLTALALETGYCDQSHFIREFRRVVGQSPQRFFQATTHC